MIILLWNLALAIVWMLLQDNFTLTSLFMGLLVGWGAMRVGGLLLTGSKQSMVLSNSLKLIVMFAKNIFQANLVLARDLLVPKPRFKHAFIEVDVSQISGTQALILGNIVSLTPGSLTIDSDGSGTKLYIHTLYGDDLEVLRNQIDSFRELLVPFQASKQCFDVGGY